MIFLQPLSFVSSYVSLLDSSVREVTGGEGLTRIQRAWLAACLMSMLVFGELNWECLERGSVGTWRARAASKMFRHGIRVWEHLLRASVSTILKKYGIRGGTLILDDSDRSRSKRTTRIFGVHKAFHKPTGGYRMSQNVVVLLLVTDTVTIPVGFRLFIPDSSLKEWERKDRILRDAGIKKGQRPRKPQRDPRYPTRPELALEMVNEFCGHFPQLKIKGVQADAAYATPELLNGLRTMLPTAAIVSQIRGNQLVLAKGGQAVQVQKLMGSLPARQDTVRLRGHLEEVVTYCSVVARVKSLGDARYRIVALKYEGEDEYRYIIFSDPSWRATDIVEYYSLRWLVETFFQDWKSHGAWAQVACQQGDEGARRGVILSLLLDHCLVCHPEQSARLARKVPIVSVGSLRSAILGEVLTQSIEHIALDSNPKEKLERLRANLGALNPFRESTKHFSGRSMSRRASPTPACERRAARIAA